MENIKMTAFFLMFSFLIALGLIALICAIIALFRVYAKKKRDIFLNTLISGQVVNIKYFNRICPVTIKVVYQKERVVFTNCGMFGFDALIKRG